jgi:acyl phosphate:glycerol-3-phosphate acyltransferase
METVVTGGTIALIAYLVGSIPSAYLVGRRVAGVDLRVAGEGNVGARNAYHVVGPAWGVVVFLMDVTKGGVVGLALRDRPTWQLTLGGIAVVAGHAFPIWLGFVGGKGVATASGFGIALLLPAAAIGGAGAGAVFAVTRRFLPAVIVAIIGSFAAATLLGEPAGTMGIVVSLFALTGVKRAVDEPRMRRIEEATGWDRATGGTH